MTPAILLIPFVWAGKAITWTALFSIALVDVPLSYVGSLTEPAVAPVREPGPHIVSGFTYGSLKFDLPFTDRSCWYYAGHEPENHGYNVDARTFAFRCTDFEDTLNLEQISGARVLLYPILADIRGDHHHEHQSYLLPEEESGVKGEHHES